MCKAGQAAESYLQGLANDATASAAESATSAAAAWVNHPTPILGSLNEDGSVTTHPVVEATLSALHPWTMALAVLSLLIAGTRVVWHQRTEDGVDAVKGLVRMMVITGGGVVGVGIVSAMLDAFCTWLLGASTANFQDAFTKVLGLSADQTGLGTPLTVLFVAICGWGVSCLQIALLYVRDSVLMVLTGVWPTTAAITNTELGYSMYRRTGCWMLAYLIYKPTAAILYANAFLSAQDATTAGGDPLSGAIHGLALYALAIVALPATLKLINPLTSAMSGSGGSGAGSAALMAAPTGIASVKSTPTPTGGGGAGAAAGGGPVGIALATVGAVSSTAQGTANTAVAGGPDPGPPPAAPRTSHPSTS
jgi:hypothetical protein